MIDKIKAPLRKGKKEAREKRADTIDLVGQHDCHFKTVTFFCEVNNKPLKYLKG